MPLVSGRNGPTELVVGAGYVGFKTCDSSFEVADRNTGSVTARPGPIAGLRLVRLVDDRVFATTGDTIYAFPIDPSGGAPATFAKVASGTIALSPELLLYTATNGGDVFRCSTDGGCPGDGASAHLTTTEDVSAELVDEHSAYFRTFNENVGTVFELQLDDGGVTQRALGATANFISTRFAEDDDTVFWGRCSGCPSGDAVTITAMGKNAGATPFDIVTELAGVGSITSLVQVGGQIFFTTMGTVAREHGDGALWRVDARGGSPTRLVGDLAHPHALATDGVDVYWATVGKHSDEPMAREGDATFCYGSVGQIEKLVGR